LLTKYISIQQLKKRIKKKYGENGKWVLIVFESKVCDINRNDHVVLACYGKCSFKFEPQLFLVAMTTLKKESQVHINY
jgi:hypothetical protein